METNTSGPFAKHCHEAPWEEDGKRLRTPSDAPGVDSDRHRTRHRYAAMRSIASSAARAARNASHAMTS